ncbi:hypothetical protein BaRGS_00036828 [Batillaria attramentaria]|uniref:Uncharacterized protein n=1 Tax=Batillaria attramentaria TaxID=370345 RepID=A0ABD0JBD2_9CAEN
MRQLPRFPGNHLLRILLGDHPTKDEESQVQYSFSGARIWHLRWHLPAGRCDFVRTSGSTHGMEAANTTHASIDQLLKQYPVSSGATRRAKVSSMSGTRLVEEAARMHVRRIFNNSKQFPAVESLWARLQY